MEPSLPAALEERIKHYEDGHDPGPFSGSDWTWAIATGVLLPVVCLVIGWLVGWPS